MPDAMILSVTIATEYGQIAELIVAAIVVNVMNFEHCSVLVVSAHQALLEQAFGN